MASQFRLREKVFEFLSARPEQRFIGRTIAEWIFENYRDDCEEKRRQSKTKTVDINTDSGLITVIAGEISSHYAHGNFQKVNPELKMEGERPRKYYYSETTDEQEITESETTGIVSTGEDKQEKRLTEHDLYPKLAEYLAISDYGLYSKRIDERRSRNRHGRGGNHWLYPDVVSVENLSAVWDGSITGLVEQSGNVKVKLWSFEVKLLVNRSNVREVFFQAVSNSSWANFGYLVAHTIRDNVLPELRILSSLHGIGFILLDVDNPSDSEILIPARERPDVDWDTMNRIAEANVDFHEYVASIVKFYKINEMRTEEWDAYPEQYIDDE